MRYGLVPRRRGDGRRVKEGLAAAGAGLGIRGREDRPDFGRTEGGGTVDERTQWRQILEGGRDSVGVRFLAKPPLKGH